MAYDTDFVQDYFAKAVDTALVPVGESDKRYMHVCFLDPSWVAVRQSGGLGCKGGAKYTPVQIIHCTYEKGGVVGDNACKLFVPANTGGRISWCCRG
eukprot:11661917-Ditylum_brightwellii.AAC.1